MTILSCFSWKLTNGLIGISWEEEVKRWEKEEELARRKRSNFYVST